MCGFKAEILDEFKDLLAKQRIPNSLDEDSRSELKSIVRSSVEEAISNFSSAYDLRLQKLEDKFAEIESGLREKNETLKEVAEKTTSLENENKELKEKVDALEEEIEERTNRSLRSHIVLKNVPKSGKETWSTTTNIAAKVIQTASCGAISFAQAHNMLERCHRGKPRENSSSPPPIYALIDDWRNAEWIRNEFRKKPKEYNVWCDQKYGTRTTWRRNQALQKRKELKRKGDIVGGYVKYPALLMVRKEVGGDFVEDEDFSTMPVVFDE